LFHFAEFFTGTFRDVLGTKAISASKMLTEAQGRTSSTKIKCAWKKRETPWKQCI